MNNRVPINKRLLLKNSVSGLINKALTMAVLVWLQPYLLRRVSTDEYSLLPIMLSVMAFVKIMQFIFAGGVSRYMVEAYAKGDEDRVTEIVSTMFVFQLLGVFALSIGATFLIKNMDRLFTLPPELIGQARIMMGLMIGSFCLHLLLACFEAGIAMKQAYVAYNAIAFGRTALRLGILFLLLFTLGPRVLWVVVATEAAAIAALIGRVVVSMKGMPAIRLRISSVAFKGTGNVLAFNGWFFASQFASQIRNHADPIILAGIADSVSVTIFHLGNFIVRTIEDTTVMMTQPILPAIISMHANNDEERLARTFLRFGRYAMWLNLIVMIPLGIFASEFMMLYVGAEFSASGTILVILLVARALGLPHSMGQKLASAIGRIRPVALWSIAFQMLNLALTFFFVGYLELGALGSAGATLVIAFVSQIFVLQRLYRGLANVGIADYLKRSLVPGIAPGLAAGACWFALKVLIGPAGWWSLLLCMGAGIPVYLFVLGRFASDEADRRDFRKIAEKLRAGFKGSSKKSDPDDSPTS